MGTSFNFDPTTVVSSIEVFPKQEYEFKVGSPKAFMKKAGEDQHDSYGLRFSLTISLPSEYEGKRTVYSIYLQSEGAQSFAKQFIMACLGYGKGRGEEERFDREQRGQDWQFDPEAATVGDAWKQLEGQRVIGGLDTQPNNKTGEPMQQFKSWRNIKSGVLNK
jgi:hypothetical protein